MTKYCFEVNNCNDAFVKICKILSEKPEFFVNPRGQATHEITNALITIKNPYDRLVYHPDRNLSLRYLAGELLWYERGSNLLSEIKEYAKFWERVSDDGITVNSSYGNRIYNPENKYIHPQWQRALNELKRDSDSRRAMLSILKSTDLTPETRDMPCTVGLQFYIRQGKLNATSWMRSNDIYLGFCYDVPIFTIWQEKMFLSLLEVYPDLRMGNYTHMATSLHVYERHLPTIKSISQTPKKAIQDSLFDMPRIKNLNSIKQVQETEAKIRKNEINIKDLPIFNDEFSAWLIKCLSN